ncbi:MAG: dihydroorotate dehydrogenase electron transfer subunit [Thermoplasmata archaeon]
MEIVEIKEIVPETPSITTLFFDLEIDISPGQFVMVWAPGVDEMPMSLSYQEELQGITVRKVGAGTKALHELNIGDRIGIRGPYGKGYELKGDRILAAVGGIGGASILPAVEYAVSREKEVTCALGAQTLNELLFHDRLAEITELHLATDDGSAGHYGFVTDLIEDLVQNADLVITCGPELMMKRVCEIAEKENIPVQASLERYMKCGIGLCGSCIVDGLRVCAEGPVFNGEEIQRLDEFGEYQRESSGKKVPLCRPKSSY